MQPQVRLGWPTGVGRAAASALAKPGWNRGGQDHGARWPPQQLDVTVNPSPRLTPAADSDGACLAAALDSVVVVVLIEFSLRPGSVSR